MSSEVEMSCSGGAVATEEVHEEKMSTDAENQPLQINPPPPPPKPYKISVPRISLRELRAQRAHSPTATNRELEQRGFLLSGAGAKRDNKPVIKSYELDEAVKKAKKYAMEQTVRFVLVKQQQKQQKQQLEMIKRQQALLLMCRVYVGSIFYEVKEEAVRTAFAAFGPVRSINMSWDPVNNKHKGFAFIEFEAPEAAKLAYEQMNSALLGGRNIKVGRPSNMPQAQPIIDQLTEEAKTYSRIYVASIHQELSEQDVQSVFEAFGTIRSCTLVRDAQTGKHKGYGFIEYETEKAAQDAVASMNLFDLGGQLLRVGRAITPPDPVQVEPTPITVSVPTPAANSNGQQQFQEMAAQLSPGGAKALAQSSIQTEPTVNISTQQTQSQQQQQQQQPFQPNQPELTENQKKLLGMTSADDPTASLEQQIEVTLRSKEQRLILMQKLMKRKPESKVVILRNMVGPEDVDEELQSEITDECGKYGEVERVVIYQEQQGEEEDAEVIVKIFVEFASVKSSEAAIEALNGRFFAGRVVKAEVYDQAAFLSKDYSG